MHRFGVGSGKRGTTLVEILVVMVVMLVGIFTVIQLFPTGFRVVRAAESQTVATRLAQQELERWKSMASNLPAGIVPVDEDGNVLNGQEPGPPFEAYARDANGDLKVSNGRYERGNALNNRQVISESTLIPMGSHFSTGMGAVYGSRYTLAFSPIEAKRVNGVLKTPTIKSGDLRRRQADSGYDPPYLRAGEYAIDYEVSEGQDYPQQYVFHVAFPRDPGVAKRVYYISFSYWYDGDGDPDTAPELLSVVDKPVVRNGQQYITGDDSDWVEVPIRGVGSSASESVEMEEATDTCARGFVEQPGDWTPDPYEFKLADPIVGVLAFNPVGQGKREHTARGVRPIEARISYLISDPRIIREDRVVPSPRRGATDIPVKLALRFILNVGDPTDDLKPGNPPEEQNYQGLIPGSVSLPMLVIDLASGWRVDLPSDRIDFKAGVISLPLQANIVDYSTNNTETVSLAGRHLRFFYRADGDWTVQCHKAYTVYTRDYTAGDLDYRSYRILPSASTPSGLSNRLRFAACEGLKTVVVDYPYIGSDGVEHKVVGEAHKIEKTLTGSPIWFVDLKVPPGAYIPRYGRVVVVGASFTARVLWRDGKRWRCVSMDTQLVKDH
jgi:Tfp pilus assembly protein PilV